LFERLFLWDLDFQGVELSRQKGLFIEIVLTESIFSLDIKALCYGDVNGSLIP